MDGGPGLGDLCDGGDGADTVRDPDTESVAHCETIASVEIGL